MFRKLQHQMTLFCTFITSCILVSLTIVCLIISENSLKANNYTSFLNELNSVQSHLQSESDISLQWLNQIREKNHFEFMLYDNGKPLFSQQLTAPQSTLGDTLINEAIQTAENEYHLSLFSQSNDLLVTHAEFSLTNDTGTSYYISAGTIPKKNGQLSFLVFYSLAALHNQMLRQRIAFVCADVLGILLLALFSRIFVGRMLVPLERSNKKQTAFIASASHELRTPLAVILSGLEAFEKADDDEKRRHFRTIIQQEVTRMRHLVDDLLLLANSDNKSLVLSPVSCQPDELLLAAYEKYELLAKEQHISLKISLPEEVLPDRILDPDRILMLLSILLDNALSYTGENGSIALALLVEDSGRKSHPGMLHFSVADTGCGIPDEEKEAVFSRFHQVDTAHTGKDHFGLGLCIAKEIADAHHGKLSITDTPGGGATFHFLV